MDPGTNRLGQIRLSRLVNSNRYRWDNRDADGRLVRSGCCCIVRSPVSGVGAAPGVWPWARKDMTENREAPHDSKEPNDRASERTGPPGDHHFGRAA